MGTVCIKEESGSTEMAAFLGNLSVSSTALNGRASCSLYSFSGVTVTKHHGLGGLNNWNRLSQSWRPKSQSRCQQVGSFWAMRENLVHALPQLLGELVIFGDPGLLDPSAISAFTSTWHSPCSCLWPNFPFLWGHWYIGLGTHPNDLSLA